jgi:hypothetical protein
MVKPAAILFTGSGRPEDNKPLVGALKPQAPMASRSSDGWALKSGLAIVAPPNRQARLPRCSELAGTSDESAETVRSSLRKRSL